MRLSALLVCLLATPAFAAEPDKDGFVPMFDGKTLAGWVNVNCHPTTFFVKDGEIVTTGTPTGFLRTEKQYENFVLEMEWMHVEKTKMANSGLFVWGDPLPAVGTPYTRGIEVQVLANAEVKDSYTSDGDVFSIWGATCKPDRPHPKGAQRCLPSEKRTKPAGEWNQYKVFANDGVIKLHVNGKEVSGVSQCNPRKGYLALESEGAECHFRNLKIKELPSTNPKPEQIAKVAEGHTLVFNGLDLDGWVTEDKTAWKANDGVLKATGKAELKTSASYERFELIFDAKMPAKAKGEWVVSLGTIAAEFPLTGPTDKWQRYRFQFGPKEVVKEVVGEGSTKVTQLFTAGPIRFKPIAGLELRNLFLRELK